MSTTKRKPVGHTPGNWTAKRRTFNYGCYGWEIEAPWHVQHMSSVQKLGPVCTIHTDDERDRANAALIAAAPQLLDVAERIAKWGSQTPQSAALTVADLQGIITDANAAIAKAKGGAE